MKLSRQKLRKLIIETLLESRRYIAGLEPDDVVPADVAYDSALAKDAASVGKNPQLDALRADDPLTTRELATSLGYQEQLTPAEETAYGMGKWKSQQEGEGVQTYFPEADLPMAKNSLYSKDLYPFESARDPYVVAKITGEHEYYDDDRGDIPYWDLDVIDIRTRKTFKSSVRKGSFSSYYRKR